MRWRPFTLPGITPCESGSTRSICLYQTGFHSAQLNRINSKFQLPKEPISNPMAYNPNGESP